MGVWRKWVFPSIRILLVAAIAVALTKLAFFPDAASEATGVSPGGSLEDPTVVAERGSIVNDVVLAGTVAADAPVEVKAVANGTVDEVFAKAGQAVNAGDKLFDIEVVEEVEPTTTTGPDGMPVTTTPKPRKHYEPVTAPISGVLTTLDVMPDQQVAVGAASGKIAPPSFNVTASMTPEQQYRLQDQPADAQVAITGGPAPFTCTGLTITASGGDAGAAGEGAPASPATVRCSVPGDVKVFAGLSAEVTIAAGRADDVLVLPTTAVEGGAGTGTVWLVGDDGEPVETPVTLGLNDGTSVEITGGIEEGASILQFVPGAMAPDDGCMTNPDGSTFCAAVGG